MDEQEITLEAASEHEEPQVEIDDSPEAGIEALRRQMEDNQKAADERQKSLEDERDEARRAHEGERLAREEAERRAQQSAYEAHHRAASAHEAQYDSVVNAHAAAQGELTAAKSALKSAMSEGDFDRVAELSAEIGTIAARVDRWSQGKRQLDSERESRGTATAQPPYQQPQSEADQREAFIRSRTPKTAAWLRKNDRYFSDSNFRMAVTGAHNLAIARGMLPDSEQYFSFVEEQSGLRQASAVQERTASTGTAASTTAPRIAAAPPAGSTASATPRSNSTTTVTLTAEERDMARSMGISETAYAKNKVELQREGRLGTGH